MKTLITPGELSVIERYIRPGDRVFDIGAHTGTWSAAVRAAAKPCIDLHAFEPAPANFALLKEHLSGLSHGQVTLNNLALSDRVGTRCLYFYREKTGWSTFHRRHEVEIRYRLVPPLEVSVSTATIDHYCTANDIASIDFMKIDTEGHEIAVLSGATALLVQGNVNFIQFEYGGTYQDAGTTLRQVYDMLQAHGYHVFRIWDDRLDRLDDWDDAYEDYAYSNFLAVHARTARLVLDVPAAMLDIPALCRRHGITPRGVIHVGAHDGNEIAVYRTMNVGKVLFIEANPEVFRRLERKFVAAPDVILANCAICDYNGTVDLRVTSNEQSSSILRLHLHREIYPAIIEVKKVVVQARTLDALIAEMDLDIADFNILNMDIQGAELRALKGGANSTLPGIEAINTEINFEELYEDGALAAELDDFLALHGFKRVATTTPHHPTWGDAFYVRA